MGELNRSAIELADHQVTDPHVEGCEICLTFIRQHVGEAAAERDGLDVLERLIDAANRVQPFPVDAPNLPEWARVEIRRLRNLYDAVFAARRFLQESRTPSSKNATGAPSSSRDGGGAG